MKNRQLKSILHQLTLPRMECGVDGVGVEGALDSLAFDWRAVCNKDFVSHPRTLSHDRLQRIHTQIVNGRRSNNLDIIDKREAQRAATYVNKRGLSAASFTSQHNDDATDFSGEHLFDQYEFL
jgi:hypothetical protein